MTRIRLVKTICRALVILCLVCTGAAQTTVYNNFGPNQGGWDYNYALGWTVAGVNVPSQYGVEQAMDFTSTTSGVVCDVWVAFFYVPFSSGPDTVTIKLARNPNGLPPTPADVMEQWVITSFESWTQWTPPIHLVGNGTSLLQAGEDYWLWAIGGETTWCGWCMNIDPVLTCPHTMRREGEDWLPVANETASAFRVDVNAAAPVAVTLTPVNPPIVIPANGGSFQFDAAVANNSGSPVTIQAWIKVQLPNLSWYGPVLGPLTLTLPPNQSVSRRRTQTVPASAPAGLYNYRGWIGTYPGAPLDSSSFTFTKSGAGILDSGMGEWLCYGEPFPGEEFPPSLRGDRGDLVVASPNPFNASTVLRYKMQDARYISLKVYDTAGKLVATLVDDWRQVGEHQVTFDGTNLASGIYLAKLEAGEFRTVQKMILLK